MSSVNDGDHLPELMCEKTRAPEKQHLGSGREEEEPGKGEAAARVEERNPGRCGGSEPEEKNFKREGEVKCF